MIRIKRSDLKKKPAAPIRFLEVTPHRVRMQIPYPPSANKYWRCVNNVMKVSAEARAYKNAIRMACIAQRLKPIVGTIHVFMDVYRPQKSGDLDNRIKVVLDAMKDYVFGDDDEIKLIAAKRFDDKINPRVMVEVDVEV
jgi:Holliday junction resolvase RusA-like endonuclease